jgi:hypothetical protein
MQFAFLSNTQEVKSDHLNRNWNTDKGGYFLLCEEVEPQAMLETTRE